MRVFVVCAVCAHVCPTFWFVANSFACCVLGSGVGTYHETVMPVGGLAANCWPAVLGSVGNHTLSYKAASAIFHTGLTCVSLADQASTYLLPWCMHCSESSAWYLPMLSPLLLTGKQYLGRMCRPYSCHWCRPVLCARRWLTTA